MIAIFEKPRAHSHAAFSFEKRSAGSSLGLVGGRIRNIGEKTIEIGKRGGKHDPPSIGLGHIPAENRYMQQEGLL